MDKTVAIYHQARRIQQFLGRPQTGDRRAALSLSLRSFQDLSIPVSWPLLLSGVSRGRTRRGQWPGIKPGQSGGEEGVKREHVGGGGWEVGSRRVLDDKFSAIGSFDADSPPLLPHLRPNRRPNL